MHPPYRLGSQILICDYFSLPDGFRYKGACPSGRREIDGPVSFYRLFDLLISQAFAYHKSGNLDRAREEYEKIARLTIGKIDYGDIYAKSYYMLGKINEQQGNKSKAIEHYEKFLNLWKDADRGIPEIIEAWIRLAELKTE